MEEHRDDRLATRVLHRLWTSCLGPLLKIPGTLGYWIRPENLGPSSSLSSCPALAPALRQHQETWHDAPDIAERIEEPLLLFLLLLLLLTDEALDLLRRRHAIVLDLLASLYI